MDRLAGNIQSFDMYDSLAEVTAKKLKVQIVINDGEPIDAPWLYPLLGLCGETGEVAEKFKKAIRDNGAQVDFDAVELELGDVLWYVAKLGRVFKSTLGQVAWRNIEKLQSRAARGVLGGSGDNR